MFKKLVLNVCCLTMVAAICTPAALAIQLVDPVQNSGIVEPKKEDSEWVYKVTDGKLYKRLWSNTYGEWLTEWEHVPSEVRT